MTERGVTLIESIAAIAIGGLLTLASLQALFLYQERVREGAAAAYIDKLHEAAVAYAASHHFEDKRALLRDYRSVPPIRVPISELRGQGLLSRSFPDRSPYGPTPDVIYTRTEEARIPYLNIAVRTSGVPQGPAGRILVAMNAPYKGFFVSDDSLRWQHGQDSTKQEIETLLGEGNAAANEIIAFSSLPLSAVIPPTPRRTITVKINQPALRRALSQQTQKAGEAWETYVNSPIEGSYNFFANANNHPNMLRTRKRDSRHPNPSIDPNDPMADYFTSENGLDLDHLKTQFASKAKTKSPSDIERNEGMPSVASHVLRNDLYYFQSDFKPGASFALGVPRRGTTKETFTYTASGSSSYDYDASAAYFAGIIPHDPFAPDEALNVPEAYMFSRGPGTYDYVYGSEFSGSGLSYDIRGVEHFLTHDTAYSPREWDVRADPPGDLYNSFTLNLFYDNGARPLSLESAGPGGGWDDYLRGLGHDWETAGWGNYMFTQPSLIASPQYMNDVMKFGAWGKDPGRWKKTPQGTGYDIPAHACPEHYVASASWQPFDAQEQSKYDVASNLPINNTWYITQPVRKRERYLHTADGGRMMHLYRYCRYDRDPEANFLRGPAYILTPPSNDAKKEDYILTGNTDALPGDCLQRVTLPGEFSSTCLAWLQADETGVAD